MTGLGVAGQALGGQGEESPPRGEEMRLWEWVSPRRGSGIKGKEGMFWLVRAAGTLGLFLLVCCRQRAPLRPSGVAKPPLKEGVGKGKVSREDGLDDPGGFLAVTRGAPGLAEEPPSANVLAALRGAPRGAGPGWGRGAIPTWGPAGFPCIQPGRWTSPCLSLSAHQTGEGASPNPSSVPLSGLHRGKPRLAATYRV